MVNEIIAALLGASSLKVLQMFFLTKKEKHDAAVVLIKALEQHVSTMDVRLNNMQKELDSYREKYFSLQIENTELRSKYNALELQMIKLRGDQT